MDYIKFFEDHIKERVIAEFEKNLFNLHTDFRFIHYVRGFTEPILTYTIIDSEETLMKVSLTNVSFMDFDNKIVQFDIDALVSNLNGGRIIITDYEHTINA